MTVTDITETRLQREALEQRAEFDALTRLPTRARVMRVLDEAMRASARDGFVLAVCCVDLDHFKSFNDRCGRDIADQLLVELTHRLQRSLRSGRHWADAAGRLGGDEFVLLLRVASRDEARLAVERVLRVVAHPISLAGAGDAIGVTASVGATLYPPDNCDAETLLRHASHAIYSAKQGGGNMALFFDSEHNRRAHARAAAIGRVQQGLERDELMLVYQPKVDLRSGTLLGVEALLRWNHPQHGLIGPAEFLPLIERTTLAADVGDWVLARALDQAEQWQRQGLAIGVSVNVSARQLQHGDFAARLSELLARHPSELAARLELEVLETAALADIVRTGALMDRCRSMGVRFALDDFGTGYSSLSYLKRLPVDVLKIDRSFVHDMLTDAEDNAIVEGVIALAMRFGCQVVAEGVESPVQARRLVELGCVVGQGLGIAAAMPRPDLLAWARSAQSRPIDAALALSHP